MKASNRFVIPGSMEALTMPDGGLFWTYSYYDSDQNLMYSLMHNAWILDAEKYGSTGMQPDFLLVPTAFSYKDVPESYIVAHKKLLQETLSALDADPDVQQAGLWGRSSTISDHITSFRPVASSDDLHRSALDWNDEDTVFAGFLFSCPDGKPIPGLQHLELVRKTFQACSQDQILLGLLAKHRLFVFAFHRDFLVCSGKGGA